RDRPASMDLEDKRTDRISTASHRRVAGAGFRSRGNQARRRDSQVLSRRRTRFCNMRRAALLIAYSLKRVRTLVITTGLLLAALQVVLIFVAGAIQTSGGFDQLGAIIPPFARELLGPSVALVMSFGG